MTDRVGDEFFEKTKYQRGQLPGHTLDWNSKPPVAKDYSSAPQGIPSASADIEWS